MRELTTQQMIDTIRKSDKLGHAFLTAVADRLEEIIKGVGYQQFLRLRDENERLKDELKGKIAVMKHAAGKWARGEMDGDPWITDRRPTEKDGDEYGRVIAYEHDGADIHWWHYKIDKVENGQPWQQVPASMRIHTCNACSECHKYADESGRSRYCRAAEAWNPTPGMPGCVRDVK